MTGILAIETASEACSVAVFVDGQIRECFAVAPRQHSQQLFTMLEDLLPGGNLANWGIKAIAYGCGPGSFTGLRIAASAVQGLAYSCNLPAIALPTLAVLAQSALRRGDVGPGDTVLCTIDARINEVYSAVYAYDENLPVLREGPWACAPADLSPSEFGSLCAVGSGCLFLENFPLGLRANIRSSTPDLLPAARDMIPLALAKFVCGEFQSPRQVQPVYVRDEISWKKLHEQGQYQDKPGPWRQAMNIGFVGLGVMGFPMAAHLQAAGHRVCVYNRTVEKARIWVEQYGGQLGLTPRDAAKGADIVCICVGDDNDVRSVVLTQDGVLAGMPEGGVIIDHTTASAALAREVYELAAQRGLGFLDAPVSGGQVGALNGALSIMVGGEATVFARVEAVLQVYARCVRLLGPVGSGQLAKMVNQICITGVLQGLAEGMAFSKMAGLDTAAVIEVISQGAAQSWQMDNRHRTMLAHTYEHGFAVDWMRKDLAMVLAQATAFGLSLPVTRLVDNFYADVQAMGGGRWDTSSLLARMLETIDNELLIPRSTGRIGNEDEPG